MNTYLSRIIQRNVLPSAGQTGPSFLRPVSGPDYPDGATDIAWDIAPDFPLEQREVEDLPARLHNSPPPADPDRSFMTKTSGAAPVMPDDYFDGHLRPAHRDEETPRSTGTMEEPSLPASDTPAGRVESVEKTQEKNKEITLISQSGKVSTPRLSSRTVSSDNFSPPKETIKSVAEAPARPRREEREHKVKDFQPAAFQTMKTIRPPMPAPVYPKERQRATAAPTLTIGRLTVEVIAPAPKVQTVRQNESRRPAPPGPIPYTPYDKSTFGLGQS